MPSQGTQCAVDHLENAAEIFIHIDIRDSNNEKSKFFQGPCALGVTFELLVGAMCDAVDFDDQLAFHRDEVDDVFVDRMLPPKLPMR